MSSQIVYFLHTSLIKLVLFESSKQSKKKHFIKKVILSLYVCASRFYSSNVIAEL